MPPHHSETDGATAASIETEAEAALTFVSDQELREYLEEAGLDAPLADPVIASYEQAQLDALRYAMVAAAVIVLLSLVLARKIPNSRIAEIAEKQDAEVSTD